MSTTPEGMIDRLSQEIAILRQANLVLRDRVAHMSAPVKSPDDVAAALQRTVDGLQTRLASLSNPISNFAVKEFRLETNLAVSITDLGTLEYRLLQPGANVDPAAISKLTLSLVPIEKQLAVGTLSPLAFRPDKDLAAIGVTGDLRQTLEENHIFTIGDFRSATMRAQVRASLIGSEKTTREQLTRLQARAELALLPDVDATIADQLIAARVDSLQAVARSSAEGMMLIVDGLERSDAEQWIAAAQAFSGINEQTQRVARIETNPPSLFVRLNDEPYTDAAIVRQLSLRQPLSISTFRSQLIGSTGYVFEEWSNGVTARTQTLDSPETAVARFRVACHHVAAVSASPGGILTIEPSVGRVPGFPAHCYAPGSAIELVAKPEEGFALEELTISTGRTTRTVSTLRTSLVVDGPIRASATFGPTRISIKGAA